MLGRKKKRQSTASPRRGPRAAAAPLAIRGHVIDDGGRLSDVLLVWNISDDGLCIWTSSRFKRGDALRVSITVQETLELSCDVRWCRAVPDGSGWLVGLETTHPSAALRLLHASLKDRAEAV